MRHILTTFVIGLLWFLPADRVQADGLAEGGPVSGKFLVKATSGARLSTLRLSLADGQHIDRVSQLKVSDDLPGAGQWNQWHIFRTDNADMTTDQVVQLLGADNVEYVEQDHYLVFFDYPSDSLFSHQWYLHNTGQSYWGIERIDGELNDTLRLKQGTAGADIGFDSLYLNPPAETTRVVVAIVDSGTDLVHPELIGRFWRNPDEIPDNGIDDDHNGFVDDTLGYDVSGDTIAFFSQVGDNDPTDAVGHGTHIAGIVAATSDNDGIAGIAPTAKIMPVKIRPNATNAVGAAGIVYAVNAGADVINLSWGTPFESMILREAISMARHNGVFVSIAAGNSGSNDRFFPAAFDSAFAVAAGNSDGFMAFFSTWGTIIDLVAPGLDILSLRAAGTDMYARLDEPNVRIIGEDSLYYLADGTSMAAPMVAGAAAVILSVRPDLSLDRLETILRQGARDIVDPWDEGDSLYGPDSISGYGYLDVESSLSLLTNGGLHIAEPVLKSRYVREVAVKIAPVAGYSGGWVLEYSFDPESGEWLRLADGIFPPSDSIAYTFGIADQSGHYSLRLTDDFGSAHVTSFVFVNEDRVEITSPEPAQEFDYTIPIYGSAYGLNYDTLTISYETAAGDPVLLTTSTGEYFDSLLYTWNASGVEPGDYTIVITGYFRDFQLTDEVSIHINSAFANGWPQKTTGRGAYTAVCADLDKDGIKEIIVGTTFGLDVFHADGHSVEGFPILIDYDCRSVPAVYDVDRDGLDEIIFTCELGVFAVNHDGTLALGWPRLWPNLRKEQHPSPQASGYPHPVVTELGIGLLFDSAIVCVRDSGQVLAYEFDGEAYFHSADPPRYPAALFTSFNTNPAGSFFFSGNAVSSTDLVGDGLNEVIVTLSSSSPIAGVGVFEGRTGEPAFDMPEPYVCTTQVVYGTVLADLNSDELPEIITVGTDETGTRKIWVKTKGVDDLPGWPRLLPEVDGYRGSYPMVADLDLDGSPEILCAFFEFDVASLYVFRSDGSPYITVEGRPAGELYTAAVTFGTPIVANLVGDNYPEIIIRSGYILPGTGHEQIHILDHSGIPVPGWPVNTPAPPEQVFSTTFVPLVDDVDSDGLVELVLVGEANEIYIWDFDASIDNGRNVGRLFMDKSNTSIYGDRRTVTDVPDDNLPLPLTYKLEQNYPNPFNPQTTIGFSVGARSHVKLEVFNVLGRHVNTLVDERLRPGRYEAIFDGSELASGTYFYRLRFGNEQTTKKMVLLK